MKWTRGKDGEVGMVDDCQQLACSSVSVDAIIIIILPQNNI